MFLEVHKSCEQAIQRTLKNCNHVRNKYGQTLPKVAQQKLGSIANDL